MAYLLLFIGIELAESAVKALGNEQRIIAEAACSSGRFGDRARADTFGRKDDPVGLELAPRVADAITRFANAVPNGGYGPRNYRFQDHGLNADAEREKFRFYVQRFAID